MVVGSVWIWILDCGFVDPEVKCSALGWLASGHMVLSYPCRSWGLEGVLD